MPDHDPLPLSREEARQLAEQLAVLTKAGLPLAAGLRAAAKEIPSHRLSSAMLVVAERLEQGRSLDDVLRGTPRLMPEHMLRLIETGVRSGNLAEVLAQLVEIDRLSFDQRRAVRMAVAYPLLLLTLCIALLIFLTVFVVPDFVEVFHDFGTRLPWQTLALFWFSGEHVLSAIGFGLAAITMAVVATRVSLAPQQWRWLQTRIPMFGPMILWRGIANWARLASLLIKQGLPAPEALRLAATGVNDALVAVEGLRLAKIASTGRSIADSLETVGRLPPSIVPLVRWGEAHNALPDAFDTVAKMFENRLRLRASLLHSVVPPVAFIFTAFLGLWLINAIMLPLVSLITSLSGGSRNGPRPPANAADITMYVGPALLAVVLLVGIIIWIRSLRVVVSDPTRKAISETRSAIDFTMRIGFWILLFFTLLVLMTALATVLGFVLWLFTLVVALSIKVRHTDAERRSLMWLLGTAVEKGAPLAAAARAFGEERNDRLGASARRLALQLDRGASLDEAIYYSNLRLPNDVLVAVRTGNVTRSPSALVNATTKRTLSSEAVIHSLAGKLLYMGLFLMMAAFIIMFVQIKILPAFVKIFADFSVPMPASTTLLMSTGAHANAIGFVLFWLMMGLFSVMVYALVRYTGLMQWDPPLIRRLSQPLDEAIVLRSLGDAVAQHTPLPVMIDALAERYPKEYIRQRLLNVAKRIASGGDWCDSLHASGLLPKAEAGVLKAAERVGNLPWALSSMADRLSRKFITRASGLIAIGFPLILFLFAAIVFWVTYAMIEPLAKLISELA